MLRLFRKIVSQDRDINTLQNSVEQIINPIAKLPILDGVFLKDLDITTASLKFNHQLLRTPQGFFIVGKNGPGDIYRTGWTDTTISLKSTVAVNCAIWVF